MTPMNKNTRSYKNQVELQNKKVICRGALALAAYEVRLDIGRILQNQGYY